MTIEIKRPSELSPAEIDAWRQIQAVRLRLASPFLSPDWAQAVERAQGPGCGVKVAVSHDALGRPGFLAARVGAFTALPIGAPLCDYQAVVADDRTDLPTAPAFLRALGVQRLDFSHLLTDDVVLGRGVKGSHESYVVDLSGGWDAYEAETRQKSDVLKDIAKKRRKIERDLGPIRFTALSDDEGDFRRIMAWKREQYRKTRQTDVLAKPWVADLMEDLWARRHAPFGGGLFTLHIGDRLAAAQFNLRGPGVINAWFIGHEAEWDRWSPGLVMFGDMMRWMAESDRSTWSDLVLDLGPVAYRFKDRIANATREIGWGYVGTAAPATAFRAAAYGVRRAAEALPLGRVSHWPGKAMRRLDLMRALA